MAMNGKKRATKCCGVHEIRRFIIVVRQDKEQHGFAT
jgi:hypothetical protein